MVMTAAVFAVLGWFGNQVFGPKERPRETVETGDPAVGVWRAETVEFNPPT